MATRMRLQRHGRKKRPFYHIVVADGRAPRNGRFIERIGYYNPIAIPAEINLDFEKALDWYSKGAQPTDTVRNILHQEGVLLRYHLQIGVQKGALTQSEADVKFNEWKEARINKQASKQNEAEQQERAKRKKLLEAEKKVNETRLAKIQERNLAILKEREEAARKAYAEQNTATEENQTESEAISETEPTPEVEA